MDGYVSKPIRATELFRALAAVLDRADAQQDVPEPIESLEGPEWSAALRAAGGDEALLRELIETFQREGPALMEAALQALREGDRSALRRAAHTLKSSLGLFGADAARDLAQAIETQAEQAPLDDLRAPCETLAGMLSTMLANWTRP
jgi:protein-histidine pros-kinase